MLLRTPRGPVLFAMRKKCVCQNCQNLPKPAQKVPRYTLSSTSASSSVCTRSRLRSSGESVNLHQILSLERITCLVQAASVSLHWPPHWSHTRDTHWHKKSTNTVPVVQVRAPDPQLKTHHSTCTSKHETVAVAVYMCGRNYKNAGHALAPK